MIKAQIRQTLPAQPAGNDMHVRSDTERLSAMSRSTTQEPDAALCSTSIVQARSTVGMRSNMRERRANPIGRAATANIPRTTVGGLRLAVLDVEQTADFMIEMVSPQRRLDRPLYLTSANGEVLARCSTEPMTERLFRAADLINADGQPLVTVSRFKSSLALPERVATTDLFHVVARKAQAAGLSFYMFGADAAENAAAVANVRKMYPKLNIVGHRTAICAARRCGPRSTRSMRWRPTISGSRWAFPTSKPSSRSSRRGFAMSASSRPREAYSTFCPAPVPARRNGCRMPGSNGRGVPGSSRAGCSGYLTSNPRALYLLFNRSSSG
jgi:Glycosyl transferase WecG/TagA/CpsF family